MLSRTLMLAAALAMAAILSRSLLPTAPDQPRAAAALDALAPAEQCLGYFEFRGVGDQREQWEQTAAYRSMIRSGLLKVTRKYLAANLIDTMPDRRRDQVRWVDAQAEAVTTWIIENGGAVGAWGDLSDEPAVAVLLPDGQTALGYLREFGGDAPQPLPESAGLTEEGDGYRFSLDRSLAFAVLPYRDTLILSDTMANAVDVRDRIEAGGPSVSQHPKFPKDVSENALLVGFTDFEPLQAASDQLPPQRTEFGPTPLTVRQVLEPLGVFDLTDLDLHSRIDGEAIRTTFRINTDGSPRGPAAVKLNSSLTLADLPPIPANSPGFAVSRLKGEQVYEATLDALAKVVVAANPDVQSEAAARELIDTEIDTNLRRQFDGENPVEVLLPALGDLVGLYDMPAAGPLTPQTTLFVSIRDRETFQAFFEGLLDVLSEQLPAERGTIEFENADGFDRFTFRYTGLPFPVVGGLSDGWAVIGFDKGGVDSFFARAASGEGGWQPSEEVLARSPQLSGEFVSMTYIDTAASWKRGQTYLAMGLPLAGAATGKPLPPFPFPSDSYLTKPMFPNVTVATASDDGVVVECVASAPAFPLGSSVAVGPALPLLGVAGFVGVVQQGGMRSRSSSSDARNNLKQIGLAGFNYLDTYGTFPPATVAGSAPKESDRLSFYHALLPFMDQAALHQTIDAEAAWNAPQNREATSTRIATLMHPDMADRIAPAAQPGQPVVEAAPTYFVGNAGTAFEGEQPQAGFLSDDGRKIADIRDGTSNTIAYWETSQPGDWAQGGRDTVRAITKTPLVNGPDGLGGISRTGFNAAMSDGSVRMISNQVDPSLLRKLLTSQGGEVIDEF